MHSPGQTRRPNNGGVYSEGCRDYSNRNHRSLNKWLKVCSEIADCFRLCVTEMPTHEPYWSLLRTGRAELSEVESGPPKMPDYYSYHAVASRRFRVSDGSDLWNQGRVVFAPPVSQSVAPRTSHQVNSSTGLVKFGGRVFGGPGQVGTGSSVSAPD
jgi:hypothetical protein